MKKFFNSKLLFVSLAIVLAVSFILALIPYTQSIAANEFGIGCPLPFFTVRVGETLKFSTHLNIAVLAVDVLIVYVLAWLYGRFIVKNHK